MITTEAPFRKPLPGGLLERVTTTVDNHLLYGISPEPALCGPIHALGNDDLCVDGTGTAEKDLDDGFEDSLVLPTWLTYRAVTCFLNGGDFESQVVDWFNARVSHAVEAGLQAAFTEVGGDAEATQVYSGTSPRMALAALEDWVGDIGVGTLMGTRGTVTQMGSDIRYNGAFDLFTRQGTPVVNASGLTLPAATIGVMYAVGPMELFSGEAIVTNLSVPSTNRRTVLVERTWGAVLNCGVAVALITEA